MSRCRIYSLHKINSKRIIALTVKYKLELLEDNMEENLVTLDLVIFFRYDIKTMTHERKTGEVDFTK